MLGVLAGIELGSGPDMPWYDSTAGRPFLRSGYNSSCQLARPVAGRDRAALARAATDTFGYSCAVEASRPSTKKVSPGNGIF